MERKFIFVTGGVLSSLGKGILSSSIAKILKAKTNAAISLMKIDPYLNCDAGTLNPFEHGEVFVTRDGHECDLDLGNYERFLDVPAVKEQNLMMGAIYRELADKERHGDFLGKTVQLIPHATDAIKKRIRQCAEKTNSDVLVVEIGGTIGDMESEIVIESARQMKYEAKPGDVLFIHLALVPTIITGEEKTKPLQHSVTALLSRGIMPDLIVGRTAEMLKSESKIKIARQCNVREEDVFCSPNANTIYGVPLILEKQHMGKSIANKLGLMPTNENGLSEWRALVENMQNLTDTVKIAVVGKYAHSKDAYMSVFEALTHAGVHAGVKVDAQLIDAEKEENLSKKLVDFDGFIVPGGFGSRAVEGKIKTIKYCRENDRPFLGICYGFQLSVIEIARNVLELKGADTTENNPSTPYPVIDLLPEQKNVRDKGATMRLGAKKTLLKQNTMAFDIYDSVEILKRFRHRFEMNPLYVEKLQNAGVVFSGTDETKEIMKVLELKNNKFFFGTQYHPEFDSRLERPEEAFLELVKAAK